MKKYTLDLSIFILIFLFVIFGLVNVGFLFNLSVNSFYILISFFVACFYLFKSGNFFKKISIIFLIFFISLFLSNIFIDTSFDGRCYHFALENLLKLGYNPIYDNLEEFAGKNNNFYNLLFVSSYPSAIEAIRANFYLIFNNMESSKITNFLLMFSGVFYSFYFFLRKIDKIKSTILVFCVLLNAVLICQINTKMVDFAIYYLFIFQLFSLLLIQKKKNLKINYLVFIMSSVLMICTKYNGLLNFSVLTSVYLVYKLIKKENLKLFLKSVLIIFVLSLIFGIQPYITNIIKYKNPFYPSVGYNKIDFMTKQNPKEFLGKNYLYKFFRSTFSSTSDSRINDEKTQDLHYKIPFSNQYDLPYFSEDMRINGFGHLFSGIFILSLFSIIYFLKKKKGILAFSILFFSVFLNPICWWARFVPQLHLIPCFCAYYFRKKHSLFYIFTLLILINGLWVLKENYAISAYKTYVMHKFYDDLYFESQNKKVYIYIDKTKKDEDDSSVLSRLSEYGIEYEIVDKTNKDFRELKNEFSISQSYKIKLIN